MSINDVTKNYLQKAYDARQSMVAVATHRGELAETKAFFRFCLKRGWINKSPAEDIEPEGRKNKGKLKLKRAEARSFFAVAEKRAREGDEGALASLCILLLGLRSSELLHRKVSDIDISDDGALFWIDRGKTRNAERNMEIPDPARGLLTKHVAGKGKDEWLFGSRGTHHARNWLLKEVHVLCKEAGVPEVCPHGLRGTWATLTSAAGVASHIVARELGHSNYSVTKAHYAQPGSDEIGRTRTMLKVLQGGR